MTPRVLKALAPGAAVLLFLTTCGAQEPTGQDHNVMTQLSQSFQRIVTKVAAATVTLDVVAYVRPEDEDDNSSSTQHDRQQLSKAHTIGSDVIVDTNGYIVRNAHVVEGEPLPISVTRGTRGFGSTYGDIGSKVQNLTPILARGLHLSPEWGMIVSDVSPGSSAQKAGLEVQDLILTMD